MKQVTVYTDGGCTGNPGPGGWAAILMYGERRREISGGSPATTNNRMELQAAIEALAALTQPCAVTLYSDSEYLRNGITTWVKGWKRTGWKSRKKKAIKNVDLWRRLDELAAGHRVEWKWLKGHAGHDHNERCDTLVGEQRAALQEKHTAAQLRESLARFRSEQAVAESDGATLDLP